MTTNYGARPGLSTVESDMREHLCIYERADAKVFPNIHEARAERERAAEVAPDCECLIVPLELAADAPVLRAELDAERAAHQAERERHAVTLEALEGLRACFRTQACDSYNVPLADRCVLPYEAGQACVMADAAIAQARGSRGAK